MAGNHDLIDDLINELNKAATSEKVALQGESEWTLWGVPIPSLAFSYMIGGASVIPCQRYIGVSGEQKSMKTALMLEIGTWFIMNNGINMHWDSEHKMDIGGINSQIDALTWWNGVAERGARILKRVASVGEMQSMTTKAVEHNRTKINPKPRGERIPILITKDTLTGRQTQDADKDLRADGAAPERGYPVAANAMTNYLETLNLLGTTVTVGWVQHMKHVIKEGGPGGYGGPEFKEKGASATRFSTSTHIRTFAGSSIRRASHPSAPFPGRTVEGVTIYLTSSLTCLGPAGRRIEVDLLWQYVDHEMPDGSVVPRQVMWWDWHGALGNLLLNMKYNAKFKPQMFDQDKKRLDETLRFVQAKKDDIKCEELGLEKASAHEFGKAVEENPEIRERVGRYLGVGRLLSVQDADIDFKAGDIPEKKKRKK